MNTSTTRTVGSPSEVEYVNEVRLVGRVSQAATSRELPSGDVLWSVRVVVDRGPGGSRGALEGATRRTVDALECVAWGARVQRSFAGWGADDVVEVHGALRRRFYRAGGAAVSLVEVDVTRARLIRRAAT